MHIHALHISKRITRLKNSQSLYVKDSAKRFILPTVTGKPGNFREFGHEIRLRTITKWHCDNEEKMKTKWGKEEKSKKNIPISLAREKRTVGTVPNNRANHRQEYSRGHRHDEEFDEDVTKPHRTEYNVQQT